MKMLSVRVFVPFYIERFDFVTNFDVVTGDNLIKKDERLVFAHISNAQQALALSHVAFVVSGGLLVRRIVLADGPVVLRPFLEDENLGGIMPNGTRLRSQGNSRRSGTD